MNLEGGDNSALKIEFRNPDAGEYLIIMVFVNNSKTILNRNKKPPIM